MTDPLLSIIIPTKDRYDTLIPVIDSFLNHIAGDDYEIVVQDNSADNTRWLQYANSRQDEKVKYFYDALPVSIKDNTNRAFENSCGQYLLFIGDDDFVSPYVLEVAEMMKEKGIENLIYPCGYYWWNTVEFASENHYHRKEALWMPKKAAAVLQEKDAKKELDRVLRNGAVHYYDLPRMYHGLTRRSVLERIKQQTGAYLVGSCPDMAFCVSAALVLDSYYYLNFPVSIFGGSRNSAAGWVAKKVHYARLEEVAFLPSNINAIWNKNIPRYWSANTIYAQTTCEVLQSFKSDKEVDFIPHYASIFVNERPLVGKALPLAFKYAKFNVWKYMELMLFLCRKCAGRFIWNYRLQHKRMGFDVSIQPDAENVMLFLKNELKSQVNIQ
jgi:glycosyltransferase involved in cell wall biosynthesis